MPLTEVDKFTRRGAQVLAQRIEAYWVSRGFRGIQVTTFEIPRMHGMIGIRSNIGPNGYPPRGPSLARTAFA